MMNIWDEKFSVEEYLYGEEPNRFLVDAVKFLPKGGRILCIGEGEGRNAAYLATLGFDVWAVDASSIGLEKAKRLADKMLVRIKTIHCNLEKFSFEDGEWDGIVSIFCHLPPKLRRFVHQNVTRALRSGGTCILEGYNPRQLLFNTGGPKDRDLLYPLELLKDDFCSLNIIHAREIEREVIEGSLHTGSASVTQFVARKN